MQPAAAAQGRLPDAVTVSRAVQDEWRARIAAEYTSAAITQHLVLWLIQAGAPPDLIEAGLVIVGDELVHSRMSHEVYQAAGGTLPPAIDRDQLGLARTSEPLEHDILRVAVRVFCLGETVAVPLFSHLREHCTIEPARAALDRILRDEVRHRDFGWDVLDWLLAIDRDDGVPARVEAALPEMLDELAASYGMANEAVATDDGVLDDADRAWGLAPPREYAEILARTLDRDYRPRFQARGIHMPGEPAVTNL
ncbi:MAG TPA: ferritin-like domain-containing protein [Kofleriaceae bacterium]|nr:ferritin-like domain-containing protein [Kofleriaceae bacterium]